MDNHDDERLPPFAIRHRKGRTPAEREFLKDADRIAEEVMRMSDEEVQAYLKEHGLEYLVTPERVEALLAQARGDTQRAASKLIVVWDRDKEEPKKD